MNLHIKSNSVSPVEIFFFDKAARLRELQFLFTLQLRDQE